MKIFLLKNSKKYLEFPSQTSQPRSANRKARDWSRKLVTQFEESHNNPCCRRLLIDSSNFNKNKKIKIYNISEYEALHIWFRFLGFDATRE